VTKEFEKIKIPNYRDGLSDLQRDRLQVDMANGINTLCDCVKESNGKTMHLYSEIYGNEDYEGLKSMTHSNSRLINWLVKALIVAGILGGAGIGIASSVGGI
jgi:hypothetical protein